VRRGSLILFALAAFFSACHEPRPRQSERAVVELIPNIPEGEKQRVIINEADYRIELARIRVEREGGLSAPPLSLELKQSTLNRMIDRRLLMIEAEKQGVHASTVAVAREIAAMRKSLPPKDFEKRLIQTYQTEKELAKTVDELLTSAALLEREVYTNVKVSEDEVRKMWDALPESEKTRPARVHAAQIVLRTEEEGRAVVAALKKGADFAELARTKSAAPEAVRGGDLGWFEAGVMPSVFDEVCFALKPGEVSELTASEYGFHIFKVLEAAPARAQTYDDARPALFERIREDRAREAEAKFLESLRSKMRIVKHEELIASIE
jgi:parvulin-like peptidyl-prolyl isomerase